MRARLGLAARGFNCWRTHVSWRPPAASTAGAATAFAESPMDATHTLLVSLTSCATLAVQAAALGGSRSHSENA